MNIFLIIILVVALAACLVATGAGYAGQPQPAGWARINWLAFGVALYILYVLILVIAGGAPVR
jgi:hypothetical protein